MANTEFESAIAAFGKAAKAKLSNPAISGAPEDQLRGPLEALVGELALIAGHVPGTVAMVGETSLAEDRTRPDYALTVRDALVGFIELKAPGKGANQASCSRWRNRGGRSPENGDDSDPGGGDGSA